METTFTVPQGSFELRRYPDPGSQPLRAWDAADEYLLAHLDEIEVADDSQLLVLNDKFGALSVAVSPHDRVAVNESAVGRIGTAANHTANDVVEPALISITDPLPERVNLVIVKIPKSAGQLEEQLHRIRPTLESTSIVVGAAMSKNVHTSTLELFESIIGPTTTSLARKKARLIHATFDVDFSVGPNPWPLRWSYDALDIVEHGGLFSSGALDHGTALLLDNLPDLGPDLDLVDLGCGSGVVGAVAGRDYPELRIRFVDELHTAVASAEATWAANDLGARAEFLVGERLAALVEKASADVILCNPPFHDDRSRGDETAWQMFVDSHRVLRAGGELRVVGNRHLGYNAKLKKIFGNCEVVASNKRFVVLSSRR